MDPGRDEEAYEGTTALVVGAARSGIAATRFLLSRGARVVLSDTKGEEALHKAIAPLRELARHGELTLELGGHQAESFRRCDFVVVSPGVPLSLECFDESRKAGIPILAEVELAYRHLKGKVVAITGTNGKTTTTTLVGELLLGAGLKGHVAGNIGTPLISYAASSSPDDIYAVELSSFQLEAIHEFRPAVASILNLTPNHLDRYAGFDDYVEAKRRIFMNQESTDFAVLNADHPPTARLAAEVKATAVLFSRRADVARGTFVQDDRLVYRDEGGDVELFRKDDISLRGDHNLENVLAASTVALLAGAAPRTMRQVVRSFKGVEHRLEWVAEIDGVQYFNDSKATSVDATIKSLEAFPGNIHVILGGRDKAGDFTLLRPLVERKVKHVLLLGEAAGKIRKALAGAAETTEVKDFREAVQLCRRHSTAGDVVLLAPACASFDTFEDYEHRGRVFKEAVYELKKDKVKP
jgi:UDP-N-acetylmuramoylalanine--D-glutamate ligase